MKLTGVELRRVALPLVTPFRTSFGVERDRDVLLVRAVTGEAEGWGECVAAAEPRYSSEYADGAADVLRRFLVPAVAAGFALQTLTGALTYLLPVVFGRGAPGNRRLTEILELAWPLRVTAVNLGVALLVTRPAGEWPSTMGWWLAGPAFFIMVAVIFYPVLQALWDSLFSYRLTAPGEHREDAENPQQRPPEPEDQQDRDRCERDEYEFTVKVS